MIVLPNFKVLKFFALTALIFFCAGNTAVFADTVLVVGTEYSHEGDITGAGNYKIGADVRNFGILHLSGDISVEGRSSVGASVTEIGSMNSSGGVSASGEKACAAYASRYSSIDVSGGVMAEGEGAYGTQALLGSSIDISGGVRAEGEEACGAQALSDSSINISGGINVSGDGSCGVRSMFSSTINISGGVVSVSGARSAAFAPQYGGIISLDNVVAGDINRTLLLTESNGTLRAGNGTLMRGNVVNNNDTNAGRVLEITLSGGSALIGAVNDAGGSASTNLNISGPGDVWRVTGDSLLNGRLSNGGTVDFGSAALGTKVTAGDLARASGTFVMKTDIVNQTADKLLITGLSEGSHYITVDNSGGAAATGDEVTVLVVDSPGGTAVFSLSHDVELGAWNYSLRQTTSGAGAQWQLYSTGASDIASSAVNTFAGAYMLGYLETQTLVQRMGDLRDSPHLRRSYVL